MGYYQRVIIVPYKLGSSSAKKLKEELQKKLTIPVLLVSKNSKTYQPRWADYVINWGCSGEWDWINNNQKHSNSTCVDKLKFFQLISEWNSDTSHKTCFVNIPEWTTDPQVAADWNKDFFVRKTLVGHSGEGIVECPAGTYYPYKTSLFVQYKKKRHEYRVHFFSNDDGVYTIIDITQKKKRKGFENVNTKIRNHQNGWVYCRDDIQIPDDLKQQALNTAFATKLPFGAVDLIWNEAENKSYVLEVNTAPGLVGTTLNFYVEAFTHEIHAY